MRLKKPQRRTLKQKDRGVSLNDFGIGILLQRTGGKNEGKIRLKETVERLLTGAKPKNEYEERVLSELRGMGLVKIDHTKVSVYDETSGL